MSPVQWGFSEVCKNKPESDWTLSGFKSHPIPSHPFPSHPHQTSSLNTCHSAVQSPAVPRVQLTDKSSCSVPAQSPTAALPAEVRSPGHSKLSHCARCLYPAGQENKPAFTSKASRVRISTCFISGLSPFCILTWKIRQTGARGSSLFLHQFLLTSDSDHSDHLTCIQITSPTFRSPHLRYTSISIF